MTPNVSSPASPQKFKLGAAFFTLLTLLTLILTACGSGSTNASKKAILTVGAQSQDVTQAGFNPYNPQPNSGIQGLIYETLFFSNINDGSYTPWLTSSYQWSDNNTTLTFTTRQNVKWSDGQAFSADDVAFTFNAMKQYVSSGADIQGVWNYLSSVTATDASTDKLANEGEAGLVGPANPTGLVLPAGKPFLDPSYANIPTTANAAQAQKYLLEQSEKQKGNSIYAE